MIHGEARVANIVLDIGSYHTYAGEAGFENPRFASYSYLTENPHKK
jgi:actin-related protein